MLEGNNDSFPYCGQNSVVVLSGNGKERSAYLVHDPVCLGVPLQVQAASEQGFIHLLETVLWARTRET